MYSYEYIGTKRWPGCWGWLEVEYVLGDYANHLLQARQTTPWQHSGVFEETMMVIQNTSIH